MAWYDNFIPPEIQAGRKALAGDWEGAGFAELGLGGSVAQSGLNDFQGSSSDLLGYDTRRQGFDTAVDQLRDLADETRQFQMKGLQEAQNYYLPVQEMNRAIYGDPSKLRK